jgi:arginyl-tRNA synthetase
MATLTTSGLEALFAELGLDVPIPHFESADMLSKPLDIGRSYIADILRSLVECDGTVAYKSIQWPSDIYSGDLAIILPKLKPGANLNELAFDITQKVPHFLFCVIYFYEFRSLQLFNLV